MKTIIRNKDHENSWTLFPTIIYTSREMFNPELIETQFGIKYRLVLALLRYEIGIVWTKWREIER